MTALPSSLPSESTEASNLSALTFRLRVLSWGQRLGASWRCVGGIAIALSTAGCISPGPTPFEVTVFSYVTVPGRNASPPTDAEPVRCLLVNGGYREIGDKRAGERGADPLRIAALVHDGLEFNHYECIGPRDPAPDLVVIYHWGCATPGSSAQERSIPSKSNLEILDLVGGRSLKNADLESERLAILSAATDERYFVSVSAYAFSPTPAQNTGELLWRTTMSVPNGGLTQLRAMPMLTAAGASLFGRETPLPRRILINIGGTLRSSLVGQR